MIKAAAASLEHKSEVGGVVLNVRNCKDAAAAAQRLARLSDTLLVEEMVTDGVAEMLVGIIGRSAVRSAPGARRRAACSPNCCATASTCCRPSASPPSRAALARLRVARLLQGFRGRPAGDVPALIEAVLACTRYAAANLERLAELDLNPVIVRPHGQGVVAVDALIRLREEH